MPIPELTTANPATRKGSGSVASASPLSYSGPAAGVHLAHDLRNGSRPYLDSDLTVTGLPASLTGADYVQAAQADKFYSAVDLMELAVPANSVVSIAHDNRLPHPNWLTGAFEETDLTVSVGGYPMQVFQYHTQRETSLTLGSNAEPGGRDGNMYLVMISKR